MDELKVPSGEEVGRLKSEVESIKEEIDEINVLEEKIRKRISSGEKFEFGDSDVCRYHELANQQYLFSFQDLVDYHNHLTYLEKKSIPKRVNSDKFKESLLSKIEGICRSSEVYQQIESIVEQSYREINK